MNTAVEAGGGGAGGRRATPSGIRSYRVNPRRDAEKWSSKNSVLGENTI